MVLNKQYFEFNQMSTGPQPSPPPVEAEAVEGEVVSSQTISSKTRTVETITVSICSFVSFIYTV